MKKLSLFFGCMVFALVANAQIFVKPVSTGLGDGSSWADACNLETAVTLPAGDVWLQQGVYALSDILIVPDAMQIYGGFLGTETLLSQRNFSTNVTIIRGNGTFGAVRLGVSAVLNGITIENGVAPNGGGVYMEATSRVENCIIQDNQAMIYGGGIYAEGDGLVHGSLIIRNRAGKDGAAIYGNALTVNSSTITKNALIECPSVTNTFVPAKLLRLLLRLP